MKKYFSLVVIALFALVLTGCDLVDSDLVKKTTEELCLENPENELCKGDILDKLETSVVSDLFNDMLENYETMDETEFCETYFSATNETLRESCKTDPSTIFPEGIEDYELDNVQVDGEEYKVELHSKTTADKIMFTLSATLEENELQLTRIQYGPIYVLAPAQTKEAVYGLLESFLDDMENEELSNKEVCLLWDGLDNDCDGVADVCDGIDDDCDGFFDNFTKDFGDHATLTVHVCHFLSGGGDDGGGEDNDCDGLAAARPKFKAGADLSKKINILDPDDDNDGMLVAEVTYTFNGHVTVLKISFDLDTTSETMRLVIVDLVEDYSFTPREDISEELDAFIKDYTDSDITNEAFYQTWFDQMLFAACGTEDTEGTKHACPASTPVRAQNAIDNLPIKHEFILKTITPPIDDSEGNEVYQAIFEARLDGHVTVLKLLYTEEDTDGVLQIKVLAYGSAFIARKDVAMQLENLIDDFQDETITDDIFCNKWFEGTTDGVGETCCPSCTRPPTRDSASDNDPIKHKFVIKTIIPPEDDSEGNEVYQAIFESVMDGHVTVLKISYTEDESEGMLRLKVTEIEYD